MPISKEDFVKGRSEDAIIVKIQEILESNKDGAFTEEEIITHIYPWPTHERSS